MIDKFLNFQKKYRETISYIFFGVLTVIFNTVLFLCIDLFIGELVANTIAFVLSVMFAYFTNTLFVFQKKLSWSTFIQFFGMRIGTIFIDNGGMWILLAGDCNKLIAKCAVNVIVIVLNYIFSKFFIYKEGENS